MGYQTLSHCETTFLCSLLTPLLPRVFRKLWLRSKTKTFNVEVFVNANVCFYWRFSLSASLWNVFGVTVFIQLNLLSLISISWFRGSEMTCGRERCRTGSESNISKVNECQYLFSSCVVSLAFHCETAFGVTVMLFDYLLFVSKWNKFRRWKMVKSIFNCEDKLLCCCCGLWVFFLFSLLGVLFILQIFIV